MNIKDIFGSLRNGYYPGNEISTPPTMDFQNSNVSTPAFVKCAHPFLSIKACRIEPFHVCFILREGNNGGMEDPLPYTVDQFALVCSSRDCV